MAKRSPIDKLQPGLDKQISAAAAPTRPQAPSRPAWTLEAARIWKDSATPKFKVDPEYPYATGTRSPFTPDRAEREAAMMQGRDPQFNVGRIHLDRLGGGVKRKLSEAETSDRTRLRRKELLGAYDRLLTSTDPIAVRVQVRNEMLKLKIDRDRDYSNESIYIPRRFEDEQTIRLDCCRWIDPAGLFLHERRLNDLGHSMLELDSTIAIEYDQDDWFWYEPFQRGYYKPIDPLVYMRHHLVPPFCFERSQQFLVEMFDDGSDHYWLCDRDGVGAMFGV